MTSAVLTDRRPVALSLASATNVYVKEAKYEFLKLLRMKAFSLSVIGFPVMFYLIFGVSMGHQGPANFNFAKYLLASYSCFGLIGASLFGVGVGLANERAHGWLEVKQASPMPPMAYLLAKLLSAVAFGLIIVTLLVTLGITLAGVHISPVEVVKLMGITVSGAIPFATMGLFLALLVPANAAPGIVNMIYLPMSFASGLWVPIEALPHWLGRIAPWLPTYHFAQLALHVVGYARPGSMTTHWEALAGFTLLLLGASWLEFSRVSSRA